MNLKTIKKYVEVIIGIIIVASSFNIFFYSNNLAAFGISGLSIVGKKVLEIDPSIFVLVGNVFLIIISFIFLGKKYTSKTIFGGLLFPVVMKLTAFLPEVIDFSNTDLLAISLVGGTITGIGCGLIYKNDFGTAGTDITNQLIVNYLKVDMGKAIAFGDGLVVIIGGFVFGVEAMVYSLITLITMSYVCNKVMRGTSKTKTFYIMTTKYKEVEKFIIENIKCDVSELNGKGGYNNKSQKILVSVIDTKYLGYIKEKIKEIDEHTFITITNSYEVLNNNVQVKSSTVK